MHRCGEFDKQLVDGLTEKIEAMDPLAYIARMKQEYDKIEAAERIIRRRCTAAVNAVSRQAMSMDLHDYTQWYIKKYPDAQKVMRGIARQPEEKIALLKQGAPDDIKQTIDTIVRNSRPKDRMHYSELVKNIHNTYQPRIAALEKRIDTLQGYITAQHSMLERYMLPVQPRQSLWQRLRGWYSRNFAAREAYHGKPVPST